MTGYVPPIEACNYGFDLFFGHRHFAADCGIDVIVIRGSNIELLIKANKWKAV